MHKPAKRPYTPPSFKSSEAFERLALGCNGQTLPPPAPPGRTRPKGGGGGCGTVGSS